MITGKTAAQKSFGSQYIGGANQWQPVKRELELLRDYLKNGYEDDSKRVAALISQKKISDRNIMD